MPSSIGRSPSWVRRSSCSGILWKGSTSFGLRWFAAPELTLARPKAPHIARRALSAPAAGHVHRPAPIAMRPLRQKSSRILSRGALETSQLRRPIGRQTGATRAPKTAHRGTAYTHVLSTSRNVDKLSHGCSRENSIAGGSSRRPATAIPPHRRSPSFRFDCKASVSAIS